MKGRLDYEWRWEVGVSVGGSDCKWGEIGVGSEWGQSGVGVGSGWSQSGGIVGSKWGQRGGGSEVGVL